jgi:hypothetical protein
MNIQQEKRSNINQLTTIEKSLICYLVSEGYAKRYIRDNHMVTTSLIKEFSGLTAIDFVVKDGAYWNKAWSGEDYVTHLCGHKDLGSFDTTFFDNGYDANNHVVHYEWTNDDCFKLALGLFERSYDLIMQSATGSASYYDGIGYMQSKLNAVFIEHLGNAEIDSDSVLSTILAQKKYADKHGTRNDSSLLDSFDPDFDECSKEQEKLSLASLMNALEA